VFSHFFLDGLAFISGSSSCLRAFLFNDFIIVYVLVVPGVLIDTLFVERDELRKDIEQLCMQQAGPGYVSVATRMLTQRYVHI
jgi:inner membrane protein involved in colicin E2 resistance